MCSPGDPIYALGVGRGQTLYGYNRARSELGIGQFVNDSHAFHSDATSALDILRDMIDFGLQTMLDENVTVNDVANPAKPWIQATRDIQAGEELFFAYGIPYWTSKWLKENPAMLEQGTTAKLLYQYLRSETTLRYGIDMMRDMKQRSSTLQQCEIPYLAFIGSWS